jgi:steroid delta-isomerase-like uncharacterized protein
MPHTDPISVTRAYFDGWNRHDVERIVAMLADDYLYESDASPGPVRGHSEFRAFAATFLAAFPDLAFEVRPAVTSDGLVVAQWIATGTHRGALVGVPPSGQRITLRGCDVNRVDNARLVHTAAYWDSATLFRQIGATAALAAATA